MPTLRHVRKTEVTHVYSALFALALRRFLIQRRNSYNDLVATSGNPY